MRGHEGQLRELFDKRMPKRLRREFEAACIDAIIGTTDDHVGAGTFVVRAWSERRSPASGRVLEAALRTLDGAASEAMLRELASPSLLPSQRRRLAVLLGRLTDVPPPEPVGRWSRAEPEQRLAVLDTWRTKLDEAGRLTLPAGPGDEAGPDQTRDGSTQSPPETRGTMPGSGYFDEDDEGDGS